MRVQKKQSLTSSKQCEQAYNICVSIYRATRRPRCHGGAGTTVIDVEKAPNNVWLRYDFLFFIYIYLCFILIIVGIGCSINANGYINTILKRMECDCLFTFCV